MNAESKPPPVLQALILADRIYTEDSGKRLIIGTFSRIWCKSFPMRLAASTWAYVLLTDVYQEVDLQLRFVRLRDNSVLLQSHPMRIPAKDPLTPLDIVVEVPPLPLPEAGAYAFECWAGNHLIGSSRLRVHGKEERTRDQT